MKTIKVFYDPRQSVAHNASFSPSAGKPEKVVAEWQKRGYPIQIAPVSPVSREDFYLVHDKQHVDDILDCKKSNGFNNTMPSVADALHWTNGSLLSAATYALASKEVTVSPTSGFHHAEYYSAMGFCTFNGLMLAAVMLKNHGKIGILDLDMHDANGTQHIMNHLRIDHVRHYSFGTEQRTSEFWGGDERGDLWLSRLPTLVESFADCALVIYQAGADPYVEDPFGGSLSETQLRERDRIVFTGLKKLGVSVTWDLAGGYTSPFQKVLDIHNATMEECCKAYAIQ